MKLALLLPGYVESPGYRHLIVIDNKLRNLGYTTIRVDACDLWQTGDGYNYTTTNYINQVKEIIDSYLPKNPTEIVLIGHSLGVLVAAYVGTLYKEVTGVICISPPISLNRSDYKWIDGFRTSKKDLPDNSSQFRELTIPVSFVEDRKQYSIINSLKKINKNTLIIIGEQDPSLSEVKRVVKDLGLTHCIKIEDMGHDFRQSEELCSRVASEIEKFLQK